MSDISFTLPEVMGIVAPLIRAVYFFVHARIQNLEKTTVTMTLFNERTNNQDKHLIRIEKAMGILLKDRGLRPPEVSTHDLENK